MSKAATGLGSDAVTLNPGYPQTTDTDLRFEPSKIVIELSCTPTLTDSCLDDAWGVHKGMGRVGLRRGMVG